MAPKTVLSIWILLGGIFISGPSILISCGPAPKLPMMPGPTTGTACLSGLGTNSEWSGETQVQIDGYVDQAKQPKISFDDQVLYWRDDPSTAIEDTQILYALKQVSGRYVYTDALFGAVDATHLDVSPAIDATNNFYFMSDRNQAATFQTLFSGTIGALSGATLQLNSLASADTAIAPTSSTVVNSDIDVSWDGSLAVVTQVVYGVHLYPDSIKLVLFNVASRALSANSSSTAFLSAVNLSSCYVYTGTLSQDLLELYYTVYPYAGASLSDARVVVSKRATTSDPFGAGSVISAIPTTYLSEAPAISYDGKTLYYHRYNASTGKFQIYKVTRP